MQINASSENWWRISFLIDFMEIKGDKNLNAVIAIQNIELYLNASYFDDIFYRTAYDDIQFPKPN